MASPNVVGMLSWVGIVAPTLYAGLTAQLSLSITPTLPYAPPKIAAKQWLAMYQLGPYWVAPLFLSGTLSNAILAWISPMGPQRNLYIAAAIAIGSVVPVTLIYYEPGINGACKWKTQTLLRDEGFEMPGFKGVPTPVHHSATNSTKAWAEKIDVKELIDIWGRMNYWRALLGIIAAGFTGYAALL
ncbi:hypothetical protein GQ53DRAFT_740880 [Thozetella sp. PMI_491]|nr:hypothetical protein GQ53DRAFT_740880 [Thozetella sp. PMI_491]